MVYRDKRMQIEYSSAKNRAPNFYRNPFGSLKQMSIDLMRRATRLLVPPYKQKRPASKLVAIVVPLSLRSELTSDEQISMRHLLHFLGDYDKYLIAPRGLRVQSDGFRVKRFSRKFFGSSVAHNRLTYARSFYQAFADYKFIFFYHLDSLVFSNQLLQWCASDLDYIGAPWLQCADTPWVQQPRVGNGGFTLIRVEAALKVLHNRFRQEPARYWFELVERNARLLEPIVATLRRRRIKHRIPRSKTVDRLQNEWSRIERPTNNDLFWADEASRYLPEFKVASVEEGLRFAFEAAPRSCFELTRGRMPFGCHAWTRFDRKFWEPYLLKTEEPLSQ
jgi:hypothetical protein